MTHSERLVNILSDGGVMRHRDLVAAGVPSVVIARVLERGAIERITDHMSGLEIGYALPGFCGPDGGPPRFAALVEMHPRGVFCMRSALQMHELTDDAQEGHVMALPPGASRRTKREWLKLVQWGDPRMFEVGVQSMEVLGQRVRVTDPARTVLDCFRKRDCPRDDARKALFELVGRQDGGGAARLLRVYDHAIALGWTDTLPAIRDAAALVPSAEPSAPPKP